MQTGQVEITTRLHAVASEDQYKLYVAGLRFHFGLWRWQRISDQPSLSFLRRTLAENNLVEPSPDPAWIVNRGADEYETELGGTKASVAGSAREALAGHVPIDKPTRIFDIGSGNNTACYERTSPRILMIGSGHNLLFALDGTLRNWLREPFRSPRLARYRSDLAASALKIADVWTVARFISGQLKDDDFNPIKALEQGESSDGVVTATTLSSVIQATKEALNQLRLKESDGRMVVTTIALGYLLDQLASHVRIPNGMQFSYPDASLWAEILPAVLDGVSRTSDPSNASKRLLSSIRRVEELQRIIGQHLEDPKLSVDSDTDVTNVLSELGDLFRTVGFEMRAKDGDVGLIEALFVIGNALWGWHFFVTDFKRWSATSEVSQTSTANAAIVRSWLERPWGILRVADMKIALAESFALGEASDERMPRLATALTPLFRYGVDHFLEECFPSLPVPASRLDRLIENRCRLRDLRESIRWVSYEAETGEIARGQELANLLVELMTLWFYAQPEQARGEMTKEGLSALVRLSRSTSWLDDLDRTQTTLLSRRQIKILEQYRLDPEEVSRDLFEFDSESGLFDRLDVYPLEEFWILPGGIEGMQVG